MSFWFDSWASNQPFSNFCTHRDITEMWSNKLAKVAKFVVDGLWEWPPGILQNIHHLQEVLPRLSDDHDRVIWISRQGRQKDFSVNQVWDDLRPGASIVEWGDLVWYSKRIPKQCFCLWLAIRNRLLTHDRLKSWQIHDRVVCSFCEKVPDSLSHLLFECGFCPQILLDIQRRGYHLLIQGRRESFIHNSAINWRCKSLRVLINKIVLAAVVFHIWQERNRRSFQ